MLNMIILTNEYPYGSQETFLETEVQYYQKLDRVIIFPINNSGSKVVRSVPSNFTVVNTKSINKAIPIFYYRDICLEKYVLLNKFGFKRIVLEGDIFNEMNDFYKIAYYKSLSIVHQLHKMGIQKKDRLVIYSYWMREHALIAAFLKRRFPNSKLVTRCHRYDIYEEAAENSYLPFRRLILNTFDLICPISNDGKKYLAHNYGEVRARIKVFRLGVESKYKPYYRNDDRNVKLKVISCSNLYPVKRIDRIIDALSEINDIEIEWHHFGDGILEKGLRALCERKLVNRNVKWYFEGRVSNKEMLSYYEKEQPHILINTSESEGIPVSMMEAMSYGIPVVATNVCGVNEIVSDQNNGFLLDADFRTEQLVDRIQRIRYMSENDYLRLKKNAYMIYQKRYNAELNYKEFVNQLLKMYKD